MAKRKRQSAAPSEPEASSTNPSSASASARSTGFAHLQIITGTYEKTLHGFIASIPLSAPTSSSTSSISLSTNFTDTFLFNAHTAPLRTISISPPAANSTKRILATSSADERVNLYTLSTTLPPLTNSLLKPLSGRNKNLGTLHHHLNTPTALVFTPNRAKLLSAGADGQINILRTRDWNLLSTLKAPKPKPKPLNYAKDYGEGYGPRIDTFGTEGYGGGAGAINDIALHPSQKILLSVATKERSVRMWNLMTGRKAGVLVFGKDVVPREFGSEGLRIEWNKEGSEYAIAFDRGIVVFGMDSKPRSHPAPLPRSRIHQMRYATLPRHLFPSASSSPEEEIEVLITATEDGRILFHSLTPDATLNPSDPLTTPILGVLGGRTLGMPGRVKDFTLLELESQDKTRKIYVVTGGSDGVVRVWDLCGSGSDEVEVSEANPTAPAKVKGDDGEEKRRKKVKVDDAMELDEEEGEKKKKGEVKQVGRLVGMYETARRITCLTGMVMVEGGPEDEDEEVEEAEEMSEEESSDEESE
ncbi:WD40 repeat-like protein [Ascodesmis nigricans]|uniref:WD40 repeat-like protein n=1 Tax=Ascodesmis nigricans TaxID=341454 RepID=A0A4S2N4W3_9PEZI|nr:WD40 repeat-like protein [Ascodesmis nigricans]